jgi:hypothetical protein
MKMLKGFTLTLTILALCVFGMSLMGCKKKKNSNDQTSSGGGEGGAPPPSSAPQVFSLTVTKSGGGDGTVASSAAEISCGSNCTHPFTSGDVVTLTQQQSIGYFTGWGGACSGDKQCTVTMAADKTVTAAFEMVSVDGDYCQQNGASIFCFFVRSNAIVQTALGTSQNGGSTTCRDNFYSGNLISNRSFNINANSVQLAGNFNSAYRITGHYNGSASPCTAAASNDFDYEVTRPNPNSVGSASFGRFPTYDPKFKK